MTKCTHFDYMTKLDIDAFLNDYEFEKWEKSAIICISTL